MSRSGVGFGENWISIDPAADYDKTHAAVLEVVNGYPGLRRDVQTYLKERIREVLTGSSDAIVVRIYGPDLGVLEDIADDVEERLESVAGHHRPALRAARRRAADPGQGRPGQGAAVRGQARRRPADRLHLCRRRRGR